MTIFYHTIYRDYGFIMKQEQRDCNTQDIIDELNYIEENNIDRDTHNTLEDAYLQMIKDFKNRVEILKYYVDNIPEYIIKFVGDYNIYEFNLVKQEKIEYFNNKIDYINNFIKDLENRVDIVKDWEHYYKRSYKSNYSYDMLESDKINLLLTGK
jgi:hypothetical protein